MLASVRARWNALDAATKQLLFVVGVALGVFNAVGLGVWAATGYADMAAGGLVTLGLVAGVAGLVWLAQRLFPDEERR